MSKKNLKRETVWVVGGHIASGGSTKTSLTLATFVCFPGWSYCSFFPTSTPYFTKIRTNAYHQSVMQQVLMHLTKAGVDMSTYEEFSVTE